MAGLTKLNPALTAAISSDNIIMGPGCFYLMPDATRHPAFRHTEKALDSGSSPE